MRNALLLLCSMLVMHASYAQKVRFTDASNAWQIVYNHEVGSNPWYPTLFTIQFSGDTIVNGFSYKKTMQGYPYPSNMALFREDTLAEKVWCKIIGNISDSNEYVIYDNNWAVGDSIIRFKYNQRMNGYITGKDSVRIAGIWHRRFRVYVDRTTAHIWDIVEGLGSSGGPAFAAFPYTFEDAWRIYCFSNNGTHPLISPQLSAFGYAFDNSQSGSLSVATHAKGSLLQVYPNPATDEVNIRHTVGLNGVTITVYDITGRPLAAQQMGNHDLKFNMAGCAAGLYYIKLQSSSIAEFVKLVLTR